MDVFYRHLPKMTVSENYGDEMYNFNLKQRLKLAGIHAFISIVLLLIALYFIVIVWYPSPLEIAVGVGTVYFTLLVVDLILGPLLTLVVYKEDKRKLRFDLAVILAIQLIAYFFGLYTIAQGRPVWQVFVIDDVELISPSNLKKTSDYEMKSEFAPSIFKQPQWVAAVYSDNPKKKQQQKEDEMFKGINISQRPETYKNITMKKTAIVSKLKGLEELKQFNVSDEKLNQKLEKYPEAAGWLPIKAPKQDVVAIFDQNGKPLGSVDLRPWD